MPFSPLPEILDELRAGRMVILTDDEDRENEGDLILPAQFVTPEAITFLLSVARGYLCLSLTPEDCDRLDLSPQAARNTSFRGTPFTVSIDGHPKHGFTTGVSARERARSIKLAIDPTSTPNDFVRPGHINPLRSREGGVLVRTGQTEGSIDLCRLAGLYPAACIIEIMRDDGEMARLDDLKELARKHNIKLCSVAQIIEHRLEKESLVKRLEPAGGTKLRTTLGEFNLIAFQSSVDLLPHVALCVGGVGDLGPDGKPVIQAKPTLVRMHRRNLLGDVFLSEESSPEGPTGKTLQEAMRMIQAEGRGVVVYLRPSEHGERPDGAAGLEHALQAPLSGHAGDMLRAGDLPKHMRDVGVGAQILRELGVRDVHLLTNHKRGMPGLLAYGVHVTEFFSI